MAYGDPSPSAPIVSGVQANGGLPPRMSLDAVACLSGVTTAQLAGLNGPFDGAIVVTTGASATGDGLGKAWVWVEGDTTTANGTTVLGTGPYGRWRDATALTGGGTGAGTSITLDPAAGQITDAGTVQASNVQLAITGARVYTGILAATGGQLIKVFTNTSAFDATFNHQDGAATAANRVITSTGAAFVLAAGKSATFVYDTTAQRWRIAGQDVPFADAAGTAQQSSSLDNLTTAQLFTQPAVTGRTVVTTGRFDAGDGGGGTFYGDASSSAPADGGRIGGTSGRWFSKRTKRTIYAEEYLGALDGTAKDAAVANLIAACGQSVTEVIFPGGQLILPSTGLRFRPGVKVFGNTRKRDMTAMSLAFGQSPTIFWWDSANTTTPMLRVVRHEDVRGIAFGAKLGRTVKCAIAFTEIPSESPFYRASSCKVRDIITFGSGTTVGGVGCGAMTDAVIIGEGTDANADYLEVEDCYFEGFERYGLSLVGGEPYHITCTESAFFQMYRANASGYNHWGSAFNVAIGSSSLIATKCVFSRVEEVLRISGDASFVHIDECDCEYAKKLVYGGGGFYNGSTKIRIRGGTYKTHNGEATPNYAATDHNVVDLLFGASMVEIDTFAQSPDGAGLKIRTPEHSIVSLRGLWADADPFRREKPMGVNRTGRTVAEYKALLPELDGVWAYRPTFRGGCENGDGFATLSDAMTTVDVGLYPVEVARPAIRVWEDTITGTPVAGTLGVAYEDKAFRITRSAAPGSGNSVRVYWELRPLGGDEAMPYEVGFATDTVMGTATSAGFPGSASGFWGGFVYHQFAHTGGGNRCIIAHGGSNNGWAVLQGAFGNIAVSLNNGASTMHGESDAVTLPPSRTVRGAWTYDGTTLRVYIDGAQVVYSGAQSFTPQTAQRTIVGSNSQFPTIYNNNCGALLSFSGGHGVPTASDIAAWDTATRRYGYARPMGGTGVTNLVRWRFNGTGAADDEVGSSDISLVSGTAPGKRAIKPSWRS